MHTSDVAGYNFQSNPRIIDRSGSLIILLKQGWLQQNVQRNAFLAIPNGTEASKILWGLKERLRDKQVSMRNDTLRWLVEVDNAYCVTCFEGFIAPDEQFEWIPSKTLRVCYDKDCKEFRNGACLFKIPISNRASYPIIERVLKIMSNCFVDPRSFQNLQG
eukprot:Gb_28656 [translate_table: standard]